MCMLGQCSKTTTSRSKPLGSRPIDLQLTDVTAPLTDRFGPTKQMDSSISPGERRLCIAQHPPSPVRAVRVMPLSCNTNTSFVTGDSAAAQDC